MRVAVRLDVEVDLVAWGDEYGPRGAQDVREDVRRYVLDLVQQSPAAEAGAIHDVGEADR